MRLNDNTLKTLLRLEGNADFQSWLAHIAEARKQAVDDLVVACDLVQIARLQGTVATLEELLEQAKDPADVLARRSRNAGSPR